jgi:hypothetical protein
MRAAGLSLGLLTILFLLFVQIFAMLAELSR